MKLCRIGKKGKEKPALIDEQNNYRDLSEIIEDFNPSTLNFNILEKLKKLNINKLPKIDITERIGACVSNPSKFLGIGLNYKDHAIEQNLPIPKEPIIFSKATSALSGPFDEVIIPKNSKKTDWEVELGVIIGEDCEHVPKNSALSVISGYCTVNDVSEREFQAERGGQWIKGKSAPSFGPIGPFFVTSDEIPDPQNLNVELALNGNTVQSSNTSDMIFSVAEIITYMTQFMRLRTGDIIATGTPSGVGLGMKPQVFLKSGDVMDVEVQGCGRQRQAVRMHS